MTGLRRRPWWGTKMGLAAGTVLLVYAGVRVGSFQFPAVIVGAYLLSGAMGGLLFGLLIPYARHRLGATLVGVVVMAPLFLALGTLDAYVLGDAALGWAVYLIAGVLVGGLTGYVIRDTFHRDLDE